MLETGQTTNPTTKSIADIGWDALTRKDPALGALLDAEAAYQTAHLSMVASASVAAPSVLCAHGTVMSNVTAEGYPGARYHPGAVHFDEIERLAVERARHVFGATYANVQPHSCSSANLAVLGALLPRGGRILALDLGSGGHLTHGADASVSGKYYDVAHYGVEPDGRLDYDRILDRALTHRPDVVIAGASAYPRWIDFSRFRAVADRVGAWLLADISHIAGLVAAGLHPSPVDHAHATTTSTYKQLGGPRGGLILLGKDHRATAPDGRTELWKLMQRAVFPGFQGTPDPSAIAAKARALAIASGGAFQATMKRVVDDAKALADALVELGYDVLTGGTDNHMVLVDVRAAGLTGIVAERALEECGILVNRNKIPGDPLPPGVGGGLRFGTNILAQRGMGPFEVRECARIVHNVLSSIQAGDATHYELDGALRDAVRDRVRALCARFPLQFDDE
ncbi:MULTISPECIES: serine hydroxymethyltransferase [Streptomyces]|uniref:Probable serine hydroxymethyltransferase n=2 Tax=Streptomyces rochei group TaxID=2867164 RepID=H9LIX0_9ACTN|nr:MULTISPECIES: serine hydroxymethyltransferase [Streptomyces]AEF16058.1 glycine/serine hydroxymethyltransferase [Streptomyces vinaceusdrappus]GGZ81976.1 serine hydroxymethyltransferase [Streptomyces plicatus]GHC36570.1 serine hydroxymethyltransferase [Streptomyces vinaceusdrappus]